MREASGEKFRFSPLPAPIIATDSDDLTLKQREYKILSLGDQSADWPRQSVFASNDYFTVPLMRCNRWLLTFQPRLVDFSCPIW